MTNYEYDVENDSFFTYHKGKRLLLGYCITGKCIHVWTDVDLTRVEGIGKSMTAAVDNLLMFIEHRDYVSPFEEEDFATWV